MKRRTFLQSTALCAVAVSTTGFIRLNGESYEGDCETTTDILGPFYRPNAPLRSNLVIAGAPGQAVTLKGVVKHKDCITPYQNAKVELWHCGADEQYDNTSANYRYRGTTHCDEQGRYEFQTILPVPYDDGNGQIRPAHFHLFISAPGYQSLVTQLYFTGDPHIATDPYAASPLAKRRILDVKQGADGRKVVSFDVTMTDALVVEPAALAKLIGMYSDEKDQSQKTEIFKRDGQLWRRAGRIVYGLAYDHLGNNTFAQAGLPPGMTRTFAFDLLGDGRVKLTQTYVDQKGVKTTVVAFREK
ncbi:MAG: catechol 1,2-dioxygenase [Sphingobacteriaceae bacterium]|nr:catechol 1,2-dioxygenase [Cytophagaceae bacterium]